VVTAIDTNVLSSLLRGSEDEAKIAGERLRQAAIESELIISAPVFAELSAIPGADEAYIERFLETIRTEVDWQLSEAAWRSAAAAYRRYAVRRRRQKETVGPRRILADFIIGAHALTRGARLLTFDEGHYRAAFPDLVLF
jgi:predicted nucleic acid-binding protein